ncbi:MAG: hypothetical protein ACOYK9_02660 [Chlamydiia bacterium]
MHRFSLLEAVVFLGITSIGFAEINASPDEGEKTCHIFKPCCLTPWTVKGRIAAFVPQGGITREIYGSVFPEYSLEVDYFLKQNWSLFFNGSFYHQSGYPVGSSNKSKVTLVPLIIGGLLDKQYPWGKPYFGFGMGTAYINVNNNSPIVANAVEWGFASLLEAGVEAHFACHWLVDGFMAYRFNAFTFNNTDAQTGGFQIGGGVGYEF